MTVATRQVRLGNGLQVILRQSFAAPVTSTWIWYRVGSRNEVEGCTGLSHWVEHMMFKGSSQFPKGTIMRAVDRLGGYVNAMTSHDFTAYYQTLPSNQAEIALQIEADRMTTAAFEPDEVEAERTVIIAEREGGENEPRYMLAEKVMAAAFRVHPYHHQTIGWKQDLQQITHQQLVGHYRRHYMPNNAVLVVVGDIDPNEHLGLIERYFESIPPGGLPGRLAQEEPPQREERRVTLRMPGSAPIMRLSYHAPEVSHPDFVPLVVVDAILSGGKAMFAFGDTQARSARLCRALVETQLASSAGSTYHPSLDPFLFTLGATVRDGREPVEVEKALLAEITRLREEPVLERELKVAIRQTQAQFAYSSESVTAQALTLGFLEMVDRHQRMEGLLEELARVTAADVLRTARTYLTEANRTVGWFLPTSEGSGTEDEKPPVANWCQPNRGMFAYRANAPTIDAETVVRRELDNGVTVLLKENPASASVTIGGNMQAGSLHERDEAAGLASFTASMLRRGTHRRTYQELNVALDDVGASLSFAAGRDEVAFGGRALAEDVDLLVDLLAEILLMPSFPELELEKLRGQTLTHLGMLETDTGYQADCAFMKALYPPGHPYGRLVLGSKDSLRRLTRGDLLNFHRQLYHPKTLVVSVVGAIEADRVIDRLGSTLGQWRVDAPPPRWFVPPAETPAGIVTRRIEIPGKAQVDLILGGVGMPRQSPDYYPGVMANILLGRLGLMGRLGEAVRDVQGLAYYISSSLQASPGPRPWNIVAGLHPTNVDRAVTSIWREVARLRDEPIALEEIEDCKTYLTGTLPLHLETNEGIASFLLTVEEYGLGLDYLQRYPDIIARVSREEIQNTVRKYLRPDRYVMTMAGTFDL